MEDSFIPYFKHIFPHLLLWLAVPFYLGLQLSFVAQDERKARQGYSVGSYLIDAVALMFAVLLPAFMLIFSLAVFKAADRHPEALAIMFRYVVMFFYLGIWWEVFVIMAIKAYRDRGKKINRVNYAAFYALVAIALSINAFWGGEWFLKWLALFLFALVSPLLLLPPEKMSKGFLAAAVLGLILQTVGFIYASALA
jgi:hypothetical protein